MSFWTQFQPGILHIGPAGLAFGCGALGLGSLGVSGSKICRILGLNCWRISRFLRHLPFRPACLHRFQSFLVGYCRFASVRCFKICMYGRCCDLVYWHIYAAYLLVGHVPRLCIYLHVFVHMGLCLRVFLTLHMHIPTGNCQYSCLPPKKRSPFPNNMEVFCTYTEGGDGLQFFEHFQVTLFVVLSFLFLSLLLWVMSLWSGRRILGAAVWHQVLLLSDGQPQSIP